MIGSNDWKHTTAKDHLGKRVGIDLFDDEDNNQFSIYVRFADGTRNSARTVSLEDMSHARSVLKAWASEGSVNDYRRNKVPEVEHAQKSEETPTKEDGTTPPANGRAIDGFIRQWSRA